MRYGKRGRSGFFASGSNHRRARTFLGLETLEQRSMLALLGQELYPADNAWNQKIAAAPVAANSTAIINNIISNYGDGRLHPDFGQDSNISGGDLYGIPYNVVHGNSTAKTTVIIDAYPEESDLLSVPIPPSVVLEGDFQTGPRVGVNNRGDSHLIIFDVDNNIAYEFFRASRPSENGDGKWHADQETVWDMNTNAIRTIGYTSADAAGLSVLAGLVRPDEGLPVSQGGQGVIDHAIRMTLQNSIILDQFIYPASHTANPGNTNAAILPPMGIRFRLKSNVDISQFNPQAKIVAQAMKDYGMIVADNGSNFFFSGAARSVNGANQETLTWDDDDIQDSTHGLKSLHFSNFEVVDLTPRVTGLDVTTGSAGTSVTVIGQNFSGAGGNLQVLFGNTAATSVTVIDDAHVVATAPSGSGTVDVRVRSGFTTSPNPDNIKNPIFGYGISAIVAADRFTYGSDTTAPTISGVTTSNLNALGVTVTWTTNEGADTQVEYGTTTSYDSSTSLNSSLVTSHSASLSSLAAGTTYHYRVRSRDAAGNLAVSGDFTFTTLAAGAGLVAAYTFNEGAGTSVIDASGNNNWGTISGATWTTSGKYDDALLFNGTSSRVNVPDAPSLQLTSAMTLEAWVNPTSVSSAWRDVIYKGNANYYLAATSTNSGRPDGGATLGGVKQDVVGTAALATNTWTHLATTYDGASFKLFVNGVQVSSVAKSGAIRTSGNPLQIGGDSIFGQYFSGRIDEVRVYNRALSQAEIQSDMNSAGDVNSPAISGMATSNLTASGVTVSWNTSEAADTQVDYGTSASYGSSSPHVKSLTAGHSVNLAGLATSTTYHYRVRSRDAAGNLTLSGDFTFTTTADATAPTISNVAASGVGRNSATITWTTNEASDTQVEYGTTTSYGISSTLNASQVTSHSVSLSSLAAGITYHYRVRSRDAAGNLAVSADFTFTTTAPPSGLVANFTFNEGAGTTVIDASGNSNWGTISGATWTTAGKYKNALSFNGTSSRVDIFDSPSLRLTSGMTLEAWVNPASTSSAWRDVIYKGNANYYLMATSPLNGRPAGGGTLGGTQFGTLSPSALATNTWTHLAATYDGANVKLFVGGLLVSSEAKTGAIKTSGNRLQIGGDTIFGRYFTGLIDEVRVYNRALTTAEIQSDMNAAGDTLSPTLSGVATSNLTASGVTVAWTSNEAADTQVDYGASTSYGSSSTLNRSLVTSHTASLAGLAASTTYHYRLRSRDAFGNLTLSGDFTFTTPASLVAASTFQGAGIPHVLLFTRIQPILSTALSRWQSTGEDTSKLDNVEVRIANLPGATLGQAVGNTLTLDFDAAGWGWFVDQTPSDDAEFTLAGNQGEQDRMDLLSVVMHELGHLLGHNHDETGVMAESLATGTRRSELPHDHAASVDQIFSQPPGWFSDHLAARKSGRTRSEK